MQNKLGNLMNSEGQLYVRVRCESCSDCWCLINQFRCIYGGPYHGYEDVNDSGHIEEAGRDARGLR